VAEKNRTKGVSPTAVFWNPSRPSGGEAHTGLLDGVLPFLRFISYIIPLLNPYLYIQKYAAAKPPGVASSDPSKNIFFNIFSL
jgi:hypothetical protein